ncbi:hypothetical protein SAMN02787074_0410 [Chryseobacterium sp. YR221]|nr:hypothetical protein SAMN02787074_0410 [Chryseobacterium sp. YR221]
MKITVESKKDKYTRNLSKKEYKAIDHAILKINPKALYDISDNGKDTLTINCMDGFSTVMTIFKNNSKKETYFVNCLSKMDKYTSKRKNFWHATKLIFKAGNVKAKELED